VIVDLRKNGGGSLTEAINLTGLFIDEGPVVQVKDKLDRKQQYSDVEKGVAWEGPLVVLTSKFSASASEIFAGAIQDYGRGLVVGDKTTHGKGTVQSLLDLGRQLFPIPNSPQLGALKITMQQFYRPNGDSTQNRGVAADVVLPSITTWLDVGEADLDYALAFEKIDSVPFDAVRLVDDTLIDQLRRQSAERCRNSPDFQKVEKDVARYLEQKQRKTVSLNEEKFLAERAEQNAELEAVEKQLNDSNSGKDGHVVKRDFYFNEALAVTLDYIELMQRLAKN
jgi:carboxyl-terminal processing protease